MLIFSMVLAVVIIRIRYVNGVFDWFFIGGVAAVGMVFTIGGCWWIVRGKFETEDQALVRLESSLGMHNGLSAARAGVASWPACGKKVDIQLGWRWSRLLLPIIGGFCLFSSAAFIPIGQQQDGGYVAAPPKGYTDLVESVEELELDEVVDEEYIEEMKEKVEQLREANSEDWYSHSSLEAIDSLRSAHQNSAAELEQDLRKSERALQELKQAEGKMTQERQKNLLDEFDKALEGMEGGAMKPNKELLEQLKGIDPDKLGDIPKEKLDAMRQKMREHAERLKQQQEAQGEGIGEGPGEMGEGGPGEFGNGGIERGPGHPPGVLGDPNDPLEAGGFEGIDPKNPDGSLPGDLLETRVTEHEVDMRETAPQAGGAVGTEGRGGERVWQNELLPNEQKALKQFFK
ncbi:hypothetical protein ACFSW8_08435 [Rubritalea tangerina]|uniref:DUF4175 domain-containing protein n=2 Tax=Rubritalea tangerina TaxID=430798 RepID=A0ABW4ZAA1_9BACT